jgi:hypothetical protein
MSLTSRYIHVGILAALILSVSSIPVRAQVSLEALPEQTVYNDFVVGPGKIDIEMSPGETRTFQLSVSNRLGTEKTFTLQEEDFKGSRDLERPVVLLGDDHGPYSLRDYLHMGTTTIDIKHASKARIPIVISIPANAQPGGLYGSVVVGTVTKPGQLPEGGGAVGTSPIITRIGTLFFVRVKGPVQVDGKLTQFSLSGGKKILWDASSVIFNLVFENKGNVHIDPFGTITVKNMLGSTVGNLDVEAWFAMPQSLRFRQVPWTPPFLFGRYVAHASINPGYGNTNDEADIVFWVIPWKIILAVLIILIIIIGGTRWIFSRFSIVSRKRK